MTKAVAITRGLRQLIDETTHILDRGEFASLLDLFPTSDPD